MVTARNFGLRGDLQTRCKNIIQQFYRQHVIYFYLGSEERKTAHDVKQVLNNRYDHYFNIRDKWQSWVTIKTDVDRMKELGWIEMKGEHHVPKLQDGIIIHEDFIQYVEKYSDMWDIPVDMMFEFFKDEDFLNEKNITKKNLIPLRFVSVDNSTLQESDNQNIIQISEYAEKAKLIGEIINDVYTILIRNSDTIQSIISKFSLLFKQEK